MAPAKTDSPAPAKDVPLNQNQRLALKINSLPILEKANALAVLDKYRRGLATRWEEEKLAAWGLIELASPEPSANGKLPMTDSLDALAATLSRHFEGRLPIDISPPRLCQWKKGKSLGAGTPLPPGKFSNRYDTPAWAEWIERHVLPKYSRTAIAPGASELSTGTDIFRLADEAEARTKIDAASIKKIELKVLEGKYQPVEIYVDGLRNIGAIINQRLIVTERRLAQQLEAAGLKPDQAGEIAAKITDEQRQEFAVALREAASKTLL